MHRVEQFARYLLKEQKAQYLQELKAFRTLVILRTRYAHPDNKYLYVLSQKQASLGSIRFAKQWSAIIQPFLRDRTSYHLILHDYAQQIRAEHATAWLMGAEEQLHEALDKAVQLVSEQYEEWFE